MSEAMSMELVVPVTGEIVSLADPAHCARVLSEIRELEAKLRELKGALGYALKEESKRQGSKTLHYPGLEVKINTPNETVWDYAVLEELVGAGLPDERFNALVMIEKTYRVNRSVAKQLAGSNTVYAEIIDRAQTKNPREPSVSVSQK